MTNTRFGWHSGKAIAKKVTTGGLFFNKRKYSVSSSLDPDVSYVEIHASENHVDITIPAIKEGRFLVVKQTMGEDASEGTARLLLMPDVGTFDGTNHTATFNAANEALVLFAISSTRFIIVENIGSVSLG